MLIGAPLAGWVYDTYGTYDYIWYAYGALMVVAIIFIMVIPPLKKWNAPPVTGYK
jgi:predicted MFS family arabinose efflux permease